MPSPFPGMDPFIEMQEWESFHAVFIVDMADALGAILPENYVTRVERRVYSEQVFDEDPEIAVADAAILRDSNAGPLTIPAESSRATLAPVEIRLRMPRSEPRRESYITIRELPTKDVITIIELLSPSNKRHGGDGRRRYLSKRKRILKSATHSVELDLLRGGRRLPTIDPLPTGDYHVFVSRSDKRPQASVYSWTLREPMPAVRIPLKGDDPDVPLDLQSLFASRYARSSYFRSLDYTGPLKPKLDPSDAAWTQDILADHVNPHD